MREELIEYLKSKIAKQINCEFELSYSFPNEFGMVQIVCKNQFPDFNSDNLMADGFKLEHISTAMQKDEKLYFIAFIYTPNAEFLKLKRYE